MREARAVVNVLLLTASPGSVDEVLPTLGLLAHHVRVGPLASDALTDTGDAQVLLVDGRGELVAARALCRLSDGTLPTPPVLLLVPDGGWPVVDASWGTADLVAASCSPAELDARIRMAAEREGGPADADWVEAGDLVIDVSEYAARLRGRPLDLTYKEFELLRHLATHPGRVFTRTQLLQDVWGYDYYGGTRTVDVHVRRLRAKLGVEHDQMIGTVRHVGYRFSPDASGTAGTPSADEAADD